MDLGSLSASLSLDSSGFQDGLSSASTALSDFASTAAGVFAGGSLLQGMNGLVSGVSGLVGMAVNATSGFQDFATAAGIGLGDTTNAANDASAAIGGTGVSALAAADALIRYNEKIQTIQDNIATVMSGDNITAAVTKYTETLLSDQQAYADKVSSINDQIASAQRDLLETEADNAQKMQDTLSNMADSHANAMADKKEAQAHVLATTTSAVEKAALIKKYAEENQLAQDSFNRAYATKQKELKRQLDEENERAKDASDKKVATLQAQLAREATLEAEKEKKLKAQEDAEIARLTADNAKKLALYQRELADEERAYTLSQQKRASGGGGNSIMSLLPKGADRETRGAFTETSEQLKNLLGDVTRLAKTSPFPLSDIEAADQKLAAANINVEKMNPAMANFAAKSGKSLLQVGTLMDSAIHGRGMQILNTLSLQAKDLADALGHPVQNANDIAQALKEIGEGTSKNDALNKRFAGSSQAMTQTLSGQMTILNNQIQLAAIAFLGLDASTGKAKPGGILDIMLTQLRNLTSWLNSHQDEVKKFTKELSDGFINAGKVIMQIAGFIKAHWGVISTIVLAIGIAFGIVIPLITALAVPFALIGALIAAFIIGPGVGIVTLMAAVGGAIVIVGIIIGTLAALVITHFSQIKNIITTVFNFAKTLIINTINLIKDVISTDLMIIQVLWTIALSFITSAIQSFIKGAETLWNGIMTFLKTLFSNIESFFSNIVGKFASWGKNIAMAFVDAFVNTFKGASALVTGALNLIGKFLQGKSPPTEGPLKDIDKWGYNVGSSWVQGFQKAIGGIHMPSAGGFSSGLGGGGGGRTQNYNTQSNLRTTNLTMNNNFSISGQASAQNMVEYLAFQSNHFGAV